jgi:hypothetical protein
MAASNAISGFGSTLGYQAGTDGTYTTLAEITNISPPNMKVDTADVSTMDSPDSFKEYIALLADGGEVTVQLNFKASITTTITGLLRLKKTWKITLPDSSNWVFSGILTGLDGAIPHDGKVTQSFTLKISGKPTWSAS